MSDDQENSGNVPATPTGEDSTNIKAEFNRKLENLNQQLAAQNQNLDAQLQEILKRIETPKAAPVRESAPKKLNELIYDDPEQFVQEVKNTTRQEVMQDITRQQAFQNTAVVLESEYPEFNDKGSEPYKRVQAYYQQLAPHLQGTKEGLEIAAYRAAADFGLAPKSKRSKSSANEDYSMSSGAPQKARSSSSASKGEMAADQAAFAELVGAPVNDPKFKEMFKKASKRTEWNKFKGQED